MVTVVPAMAVTSAFCSPLIRSRDLLPVFIPATVLRLMVVAPLAARAVNSATGCSVVLSTETTLFGAVPVTNGLLVKPGTHVIQVARFPAVSLVAPGIATPAIVSAP